MTTPRLSVVVPAEAWRHFLRSIQARPWKLMSYLRLTRSLIPGLARRIRD